MKNNLIIPVVAGATVAAALTYLFATEEGKQLTDKIAKIIDEHLPEVGDHLKNFGEKVQEQLVGLSAKAQDIEDDIQRQ